MLTGNGHGDDRDGEVDPHGVEASKAEEGHQGHRVTNPETF